MIAMSGQNNCDGSANVSTNSSNNLVAFDESDPLLDQLMSDQTYKHFISDNFDSKTITSLHGLTINEQIIKITNGIDLLNKSLHTLVCNKYEDLLAQSTKIDNLEEVLKLIQTRIQSLLMGAQRIRTKLVDPYGRICRQIAVLNRLQTTCDLLRQTIRIVSLTKRLNESRLDESEETLLFREMAKAGHYVCQIEAIVEEDCDNSLSKINIIKNDLKSVVAFRRKLLEIADHMFRIGVEQQDSNRLTAVLQVFFSLKVLNQRVKQLTEEKQDFISRAVTEAMDVSALTQNRNSGPGRVIISMTIAQNSSLRSTLRQNIETLIENTYNTFCQMSVIYKILKKKRDSLTNSCLIEQMESTDTDGLIQFWTHITKSLSEQLCKAANDSAVVRQALETEYPNYLNSFSELWKRISRDHKEINAEKVLRSAMQCFESA